MFINLIDVFRIRTKKPRKNECMERIKFNSNCMVY